MTEILKMKVSIPEGVLVREMAGESVLLNLNTESYFGLDAMGTRMWAVLTTSASVEDAHKTLLDEFDVQAQQLTTDLDAFINKLVGLGLLHVDAA